MPPKKVICAGARVQDILAVQAPNSVVPCPTVDEVIAERADDAAALEQTDDHGRQAEKWVAACHVFKGGDEEGCDEGVGLFGGDLTCQTGGLCRVKMLGDAFPTI